MQAYTVFGWTVWTSRIIGLPIRSLSYSRHFANNLISTLFLRNSEARPQALGKLSLTPDTARNYD